jgi:hypothetical protein
MKADPAVRKDGRYACGCGKKRARWRKGAYATKRDFQADPFSTADCVRRWHDVQVRT